MTQKLPLVLPSTLRANQHEAKPRYYGAGVASDWHGGQFGNDVDQAEAMQAVANAHSANVEIDYEPQHQEGKGKNMSPQLTPLSDLTKDYGFFSGTTYRDGTIQPRQPYPATSGAGGAPVWVPANAVIHIDFLGGSPQGRAWSNGAVVALDTLIDPYEPTDLVPGMGLRYRRLLLIGSASAMALSNFTCRLQYFWPVGVVSDNLPDAFVISEVTGDNYALELALNFPVTKVTFQGYNEIDLSLLSAPLNSGNNALNAVAFTLTNVASGGRLEFALNGSAVTSGVYDTDDRPVEEPFTKATVHQGNLALQSITLYDPLPTTAGLSALSAVS